MRNWLDSNPLVAWLADVRAEWVWRATDRSGPLPARVKRRVLRRYAKGFGLDILVETGSYRGDTIAALRREFVHVYSIELSPELAQRVKRRFQSKRNVTIIQGDSGTKLAEVVRDLGSPALFWLDGHFSSGVTAHGPEATPILAELEAVLNHPVAGHVVLIDDAAWLDAQFGGCGIETIRQKIRSTRPDWSFDVRNDIIRAHALRGR